MIRGLVNIGCFIFQESQSLLIPKLDLTCWVVVSYFLSVSQLSLHCRSVSLANNLSLRAWVLAYFVSLTFIVVVEASPLLVCSEEAPAADEKVLKCKICSRGKENNRSGKAEGLIVCAKCSSASEYAPPLTREHNLLWMVWLLHQPAEDFYFCTRTSVAAVNLISPLFKLISSRW